MELKRPPFASLDYYIGSTQLWNVFEPHQQRPATMPADIFDLPNLELAAHVEQPLLVKPKAAYKIYDLSKAPTKGWSICEFYEYIKATPSGLPENLVDLEGLPHQPGTVGFAKIDSNNDKNVRKDQLGEGLVLLPFEKPEKLIPESPNPRRIRCFILSDYGSSIRNPNHKGVGDFIGLEDKDLVPLDKDLHIW